jgi:hypothetical protein
VGDWQSEHEHRFLVHFSDRGSGMREYARPLEVGDELTDGGERYRVVRAQERDTRGGFGHAWAVLKAWRARLPGRVPTVPASASDPARSLERRRATARWWEWDSCAGGIPVARASSRGAHREGFFP